MRFDQGLAFVFAESWAFIRRAWWLALLPVLPLFILALAFDYMPTGSAGALLLPVSALAAFLKTAAVYWIMRFLVLGHDLRAALTVDRNAARTFAPYLLAMTAYNLTPELLAAYISHEDSVSLTYSTFLLILLSPLFAPWSVTAPSGSATIGPLRSIQLMLPHSIWVIAFMLVLAMLLLVLGTAYVAAEFFVVVFMPDMPDVQIGQTPLSLLTSGILLAMLEAYLNVVLVVAWFVAAHRAGLRAAPPPHRPAPVIG